MSLGEHELPPYRYRVLDPQGNIAGYADTWEGARACRLYDSLDTDQELGRYRIDEMRPDPRRVRLVGQSD